MATINDIYTALVNVIVPAIYPNGTGSASIINADVKIRPGWPNPRELDTDLAAGECYISIFNSPRNKRNTSRFRNLWQAVSYELPTIFLTVANNTVTVTGEATAGQNCALTVNKQIYVYTVQIDDTINSIASELAALIPTASATDNVITITDAYKITARVGTKSLAVKELKRQEAIFQIDVWCPDFTKRETLANAIELAFADLNYLTIPDDIDARIIYNDDSDHDEYQKVAIFRRCFYYKIEYATTIKQEFNTIAGINETITAVTKIEE